MVVNDCIFTIICGFADFAVGAYRSGNAVVLRTRPVISIEPKILFNENPVPLNSSGLPCARQPDYPCLGFEVCFNMTGRGIHTGICMLLRTRMLQKKLLLVQMIKFLN